MYYVYCIECQTPNHFYVGQTAYIDKRIRKHASNNGAVFTKKHGFKNSYIITTTTTREEAIKIEVLLWKVLKSKGIIAGAY